MRTVTMKTVPARVAEQSRYTCDKCGEPCGVDQTFGNNAYGDGGVEIEMSEGESYGHSGSKRVTEIDCCIACFKAHVLPALVALGFKPREERVDW